MLRTDCEMIANALVFLVALVTALPAAVFVRPQLSLRMYGLDLDALDPAIVAIVRHRAVFFGLTAGLLFASLFVGTWRTPAVVLAGVSKIAFIGLARDVPSLSRIVRADLALVAALVLATFLEDAS